MLFAAFVALIAYTVTRDPLVTFLAGALAALLLARER